MISRLIGFYATQVRVLWEWRGGRLALLRRLIVTLLVATVAFEATDWIMGSRFEVARWVDAAFAVILMALFNALIRPVVLALAAPVSLLLVAVLVIVLQVVAFLIVANYAPGVQVDGFLVALVASFVYAIINTVLTAILGVDRSGSYYGVLVQRLMVNRSTGQTDKPGLVIIQIDGLAHPILAARMRAGSVNTMASWVREGSHKLSRWEAILPSMTSGSQAGILHGNNDGIPAFRWYERDRQHLMVSSSPVDAAADREPDLEWRGPALQQRGQHLQPAVRRCDAVVLHHRGDQDRGRRTRRQPGVPGVLLQPDRLPPLVHAVPRRVRQGDDPGAPDQALRHPAADASRAQVRRDAGRQQRPAPRRQHRADHRRDVPRDQRHLRRLHRLRRAGPPLRSRASRVAPGARRRRHGHRIADQGHRGSAAPVQVRRPVRPRPEPGRDLPAAIRRQPGRVRPQPDERTRHARRDQDAGRGVDLRQLVPVGDHPEQGRRTIGRPRGAGRQDHAMASSTSTTRRRRSPSRIRRRSPSSAPATSGLCGSPATTTD